MTERPVLEAVLLDAGGTLVRLDFEWMASEVTRLGFALDTARLRRAEIAGRRCYDASKGHTQRPGEPPPPLGTTGDTTAYFDGMLVDAAVPAALHPAILASWMERQKATGLWSRPMEGAREAMDRLGARLPIAVVSNSDGRAEQHLRDAGVLHGLDFVVDSHLVGVEKPNPRIFEIALERLRIAAHEALFVGDIGCIDVAGARAAGVHFVLIDPYGDYAGPGDQSIPGIHMLADWVFERFTIGTRVRSRATAQSSTATEGR